MNLVRLGHYFIPTSSAGEELAGSCQTALVVHVFHDELVNLGIWTQQGHPDSRTSVPVEAPRHGSASFHLATDCPWTR